MALTHNPRLGACAACRDLKAVEEDSSSADNTVAPALRTTANRSHDPFIDKLPPELSIRIFNFASICDCEDYLDELSIQHVPFCRHEQRIGFRIANVCGVWRQLAISSPRLWSKLYINLNLYRKKPSRLRMYKELIARSSCAPLWIFIQGDLTVTDNVVPAVFSPLYELLNQHSDRWYSLTQVTQPIFIECLKGNGKPTILQSLCLAHVPRWEGCVQRHFRLQDVLPSPTKVQVPSIPFDFFHIDWSGVAEASFDGLSDTGFLDLFKLSPHLRVCTIKSMHSSFGSQRPILPNATTTSKSLEELEVNFDCIRSLEYVLHSTTFPSLGSLSLTGGSGVPLEPDLLITFTSRSLPALTHLRLDAFTWDMDFCLLLSLIPSLVTLHLEQCHFNTGEVFSRLITTNGDGKFLPNLTKLRFQASSCRLSWDRIPELFPPEGLTGHGDTEVSYPRSVKYRPLSELFISIYRHFDPSDATVHILDRNLLQHMLNLRERGFQIHLLQNVNDLITVSEAYYAREGECAPRSWPPSTEIDKHCMVDESEE